MADCYFSHNLATVTYRSTNEHVKTEYGISSPPHPLYFERRKGERGAIGRFTSSYRILIRQEERPIRDRGVVSIGVAILRSGAGASFVSRSPGVRQHDLLASAGGRSALRLLHGHQVADVGQHGLEVGHGDGRRSARARTTRENTN